MMTPELALTLARYNAWQNRSIVTAADGLSDDARREDRGAFFRSIHATLNHVLWGDRMWLARFGPYDVPEPPGIRESTAYFSAWDDYRRERAATDQALLDWSAQLIADHLDGDLTWYSGSAGREITRPKAVLVMHMFNHQAHHRGQVHAMLTAAGATPEATDIAFMPD
ncbi:MAG: DinB family protein [Pseudomonadota bacterium]